MRHLRTCSWYPHRTLMCFENSSNWLERVVFGQLCNGNLYSRQLYLSLRMDPILGQSGAHSKLSNRYSNVNCSVALNRTFSGTEQLHPWAIQENMLLCCYTGRCAVLKHIAITMCDWFCSLLTINHWHYKSGILFLTKDRLAWTPPIM